MQFPDGMTIDVDGMLWVAMYNGWKVSLIPGNQRCNSCFLFATGVTRQKQMPPSVQGGGVLVIILDPDVQNLTL